MRKKVTTGGFIERARQVHGDRYDYSKVDYVNYKSRVTIICSLHGEFEQTPNSHFAGAGCQKCAKELLSNKHRSNTELFIKKAKAIHGDTYDYSMVEYVGIETKVTIVCPVHGEFKQTPHSHLKGFGCFRCGAVRAAAGRRDNTEGFVEKAKVVHGENAYDYSKVEYVSIDTKVAIHCPVHGEFEQSPYKHLLGRGCPKCGIEKGASSHRYDTESFIEKARAVHGDKYDYSKVEYFDSLTNVTIICPEHGEFEQKPVSHLQGHGCKACSFNVPEWNTDIFIEKAKAVHGDMYDYSMVDCHNAITKLTIICPKHGPFQQKPYSHLYGQGCPQCAPNRPLTLEVFLEEARDLHKAIYDYSKVVFVNAATKVSIICPKHGEFAQTPTGHLLGYGCPKCGREQAATAVRSDAESFIHKANIVHGGRYDYSKVEYVNSKTKVTIICPEHGEFYQTPNDHLTGYGCGGCSYGGFDQLQPAILYYLRVEDRIHTFWKIGVTNNSVAKRFERQRGDLEKITILQTWHYERGNDAIEREKQILIEYADDRYTGIEKPLLAGGNTELFTRDVLGLDPEYK